MKLLTALLLLLGFTGIEQAVEPATMVLRNGKIVTVDAAMPEAQAIAVRAIASLRSGPTRRFSDTSDRRHR
jgi:hypothetical protein